MLCYRRFPTIACLLLLAFCCHSPLALAATIKIGEINPLSGRLAKQGVEIHQGIAVAVAEVNETGGLDGLRVEVISRDDQSQPDVAISRARV